MNDINVNYAALQAASEQSRQVTNNLVTRLDDLQANLRHVATGWHGESMKAFDANMRVFSQELEKLRVVQGNTGNSVGNAQAAYHSQDNRSANRIMGA
jgi:WXG100 family type VII secretion target